MRSKRYKKTVGSLITSVNPQRGIMGTGSVDVWSFRIIGLHRWKTGTQARSALDTRCEAGGGHIAWNAFVPARAKNSSYGSSSEACTTNSQALLSEATIRLIVTIQVHSSLVRLAKPLYELSPRPLQTIKATFPSSVISSFSFFLVPGCTIHPLLGCVIALPHL